MKPFKTAYFFPMLLLLSIAAGGICGYALGPKALYLKPIGTIFLNTLLTAIVPLIFFSIASAIARIDRARQLLSVGVSMLGVFVVMSLIAALLMWLVIWLWPPAQGVSLTTLPTASAPIASNANKIVDIFSVTDFSQLLSHQHLMALIIFAVLVGLATLLLGDEAKVFKQFLQAADAVFFKLMALIMLAAPIGFFAYFAVLVADMGSALLVSYGRAGLIFYLSGIVYFGVMSSVYAYVARGRAGVNTLWRHMWLPATTALATCSSAASIPANLQAAKNMGVSAVVYDLVMPIGGLIHKDGSVLGAIVKIAFLLGIFHWPLTGAGVMVTAIGVAILVGTVMGAIPSGGMLGEMLILSVYGLPVSALMIIAAISILIDPLATMLNVSGNTVASLIVDRLQLNGKRDLSE